jgi:Leucine-rich repeat (LRR) protein
MTDTVPVSNRPQDALIRKYASEEAASAEESMSFREAGGRKAAVVVELVGKAKEVKRMAQTEKLEEVTLPAAAIHCAGDTAWLRENAAGITSLELEDNLFRGWESIAELTTELPRLKTISVSGNRIEPILSTPHETSKILTAFASLTKLVLNATGVRFQHLEVIKGCLPCLTDLHMASNNIAQIECYDKHSPSGDSILPFQGWPSLELLDLSDNLLQSWDGEVQKLQHFPRLQKLILNGNQLETVSIHHNSEQSDAAGNAVPFGELTLLALANNRLCTWASIDAMQKLTNLVEARVQGNPMCEQLRPSVIRQLLLVKVPSLRTVNGSEVRPRERVEAEKFYLRHCMEENQGKTAAEVAQKDCIFAECLKVRFSVPMA